MPLFMRMPSIILFKAWRTVLINLEQTSLVIQALCEREYLQPSSVLSLDSDQVQRIEHSSGECKLRASATLP